MLTRALLAVCISAGVVSACEEIEFPVKQAKRRSELVFHGTVTVQTFAPDTSQKVTFRVDRVWKGRVMETIEMPVNPMSGCVNPFRAKVDIGSEFLIFASKTPAGEEYFVTARSGEYAAEQMKQLGQGRKPKSN